MFTSNMGTGDNNVNETQRWFLKLKISISWSGLITENTKSISTIADHIHSHPTPPKKKKKLGLAGSGV